LLSRDLQFRRQIEDEMESNIDLFVDGHKILLDDRNSVVSGIDGRRSG